MRERFSGTCAGPAAWLLFVACLWSSATSAASLDPQVFPGIQAATFEVVAAKPEKDPLSYEKPLPLDLLPFQERNDKYYSIGTAFSIGDGRYVTAAHVLMIGNNSLWGPPALRDNGGRVYAIDQVRKFSLDKDFVVFTLASQPEGGGTLALDTSPKPGQAVYSVGNAYGTGVVIRDGLYTSDTPEPQDGRWKWMRFSAAASPGNSGGPLVDQQGKVLGVVLAKSPNENLNYALPIAMVQEAAERAEIDQRIVYQFDVFDTTISNTLKTSFALPLSLKDFFATFRKRADEYVDGQLKELLAKEPQRLFPNGEGSNELLHSIATMGDFPRVIGRNSNGIWVLAGDAQNDIRLSSNGYVTPGAFGKNMLFHLRRPDDVAADKLYHDPSVPMDLLLKSGFLKREVGSDKIAVTSLGKPDPATAHVDAWGRRWQVWEWPLPYANARVIMLALPVPDGYVGVLRYAISMQEHDQLINANALTDFMYVNYDGTLAQWKEFLRYTDLMPPVLKDIRIDFEYGHRFHYASKRLEYGFTPELQAIQPDSMLTLGFAFYADRGKVTWDVAEMWISAKATDDDNVMLVRNVAPSPDLDDDFRNDWDKKLRRKHPNDAVARSNNDATKITTVVGPAADAAPGVLYTAQYSAEGDVTQEAMKAKLDLLLKDLRITEY